MTKQLFLLFVLTASFATLGAQSPQPAEKGVSYGSATTAEGAIGLNELEARLKDQKFEGKIKGRVIEVCQEKGCWMKLQKENGEKLMVKFKDYGFFMPKTIVGKEVVLDGEAAVTEVSVKQQKHYAEDAGKSKDEIASIKHPKKETQFVARGVLIL